MPMSMAARLPSIRSESFPFQVTSVEDGVGTGYAASLFNDATGQQCTKGRASGFNAACLSARKYHMGIRACWCFGALDQGKNRCTAQSHLLALGQAGIACYGMHCAATGDDHLVLHCLTGPTPAGPGCRHRPVCLQCSNH